MFIVLGRTRARTATPHIFFARQRRRGPRPPPASPSASRASTDDALDLEASLVVARRRVANSQLSACRSQIGYRTVTPIENITEHRQHTRDQRDSYTRVYLYATRSPKRDLKYKLGDGGFTDACSRLDRGGAEPPAACRCGGKFGAPRGAAHARGVGRYGTSALSLPPPPSRPPSGPITGRAPPYHEPCHEPCHEPWGTRPIARGPRRWAACRRGAGRARRA